MFVFMILKAYNDMRLSEWWQIWHVWVNFLFNTIAAFWRKKAEQIEVIWCIWLSWRKISKLCSILHLLQVSDNHKTETNVKVNSYKLNDTLSAATFGRQFTV